jgi:uncharacterized protein YndB with AHSA1/START domain
MPYTLEFQRTLKAPPSRVYKAFLDPAGLAKWIPPAGYTCTVHSLDPKVGGGFRMSFTEFDSGGSQSFGGTYLALEPNQLLRYNDKFDDPGLPGEMLVTVQLAEVSCGTDLQIKQEGIPDIIPKEMCQLGWQDSLKQLAQFVELVEMPGKS